MFRAFLQLETASDALRKTKNIARRREGKTK